MSEVYLNTLKRSFQGILLQTLTDINELCDILIDMKEDLTILELGLAEKLKSTIEEYKELKEQSNVERQA